MQRGVGGVGLVWVGEEEGDRHPPAPTAAFAVEGRGGVVLVVGGYHYVHTTPALSPLLFLLLPPLMAEMQLWERRRFHSVWGGTLVHTR